ncbi:LAFE_0G02916g1_1 [Lachancea fermentati]|uniref:DNA repair protein RAD50 n=1 Tax=Lachancea fermentati TaxID=4955 RepID=A0A1G4MGZ1_LACFM|nr:LAFE_0G02916g1_1 [Lachancea fermentati]
MSAIYKLSIQGIRSFDSNERETIEFGKPLTLIVGSNGSGKTTIIECLKYATTGDLPPNSKGGAFIHDPKITGEKDVRAQVKLAFTGANGANMIVTRNIQLLVKKTTNTFKTLEGQLVAINRGERTTLSSRAAELDVQVPLYMGVPKAILDYVIFCHQEDSLWPLSEPSNLKKRFDEIFQAMKFTKALDNLKTIRKDMTVDIKILRQVVEHLKIDRDRSRATKVNISTLEHKIKDYHDQFRLVEKQLESITQRSDNLFKSNQEFQEVLSKLENLKHSRLSTSEQIKRLQDTIETLDLPKAELENLLTNYSSVLDEKRKAIGDLENKIRKSSKVLEGYREDYNRSILKEGELLAKETSYLENRKLRDALKEQIMFDENLSGDNIPVKMKELLDTRMTKMEQVISEHNKERLVLQQNLSELESSHAKEEQHLQYCNSDKLKLRKEIEEIQTKISSLVVSEEDLLREKKALNNFQTRIDNHNNERDGERINRLIKEKNVEISECEKELEKNQQLIIKNNKQSDLHAKFSLTKKSLERKRNEFDSTLSHLKSNERAKRWGLTEVSDFEMDFKTFYINLQKSMAIKTREFNEINKKVTEEEFHVSQLTQEKAAKETDIEKYSLRINETLPEDCSVEDYQEVLEETEDSYRVALENLKMHKTTLEFNLKALQVAEANNCCYLCQREFKNQEEQSNLLKELKSRTDRNFEKTLQNIVDSEGNYLRTLRGAEKDITSQKNLKKAQLEINEQLRSLKEELTKKKKVLSTVQNDLDASKEQSEYAEKFMRPTFEELARLKKEIVFLEANCTTMAEELSIYSQSNEDIMTMDELQEKQKKITDTLRNLRSEVSSLQEEKETNSEEFSKLMNKIREKTFKINDLERQFADKQNLETTLVERKKNIDHLDSVILTTRSNIEKLAEKVISEKKNLEEMNCKHSAEEGELKESFNDLKQKYDKYRNLEEQVCLYEEAGASNLVTCREEVVINKRRIEDLSTELDELSRSLNDQNGKIKDSANEQRNLRLNIDLLDLKAQFTNIDSSIRELDLQNAEAQRSEYQQQSTRLRNEFEKLSADNAGRMGEIKQLQNQIESLKSQLESDYKDVDVQYQKEWLKLQTKSLVTDDIDVYSKALDSAIMKYHSLKMQDINRIIDELWKRTYSGTDVDTIRIKSDEVSNSTRGKSYNYRVVMYKQDAELDMRGRCSAGQKVLASIIIRLALSETFGANCGVIALDEPTTNLDEENIESLAKSLNNIIEFRRHQKNFQLIVITHDEKFLTHMNASDFADHFYKVKRDDRQKSQIEWVDINRVVE